MFVFTALHLTRPSLCGRTYSIWRWSAISLGKNSKNLIPESLQNPEILQLKEQIIFLKNAKSRRLWFRQFEKFGDKAMESLRTTLAQLGRDRRFSVATSLFADNAHLMKEAIVFYHRYDRQMLGAAVSCSFVAWIALVVSFLHKLVKIWY